MVALWIEFILWLILYDSYIQVKIIIRHLCSKNLEKSIFPEMREYLVNLFSHNGVDSVFSGHVHFENFDIEEHKGIRKGSNRKSAGSTLITVRNTSDSPTGSSPEILVIKLMKDNMLWLQSTIKILGIQRKLKKIMVHVPQHITKFMLRMENQLMSKSCPLSKIQFKPS